MKLTLYIFAGIMTGLLTISSLHAQDNKAQKILDQSREKFESLSDFAASYKYKLTNKAMRSEGVEKEGSMKYKDGMYYIDLGNQEIFCDKETQWIYLKEDQEVTIVPYDPEESVSIESIYKLYKTKSNPTYLGEDNLNGSKQHKILLNSTDEEVDYNRVTIWINQKNEFIEKITLIDRNQTEEDIEIYDIQSNVGFKTSDFQFDVSKHPNVDVYDERF